MLRITCAELRVMSDGGGVAAASGILAVSLPRNVASTGGAQIQERADSACGGERAADTPPVVDHVDVKAISQMRRDELLDAIVCLLPVHVLRNELEPLHDAQAVAIYRKDLAIQRIQKDAARSLRPHAWQRKQEGLGLVIGHAMERPESHFAEPFADSYQLFAEALNLHRGHAAGLKRGNESVRFYLQECRPVASDCRAQPVEGVRVCTLTGSDGQLYEDELVERIRKISEWSRMVALPEPTVDL
jgi:hypothetical protein